MNCPRLLLSFFSFLLIAGISAAQAPDSSPVQQGQTQAPPSEGREGRHRDGLMQGQGTIGKITEINGNSLILARSDGSTTTVKLTDKTEFRKDRQPAKISDFKVGDSVMVRGDENPDHSVTAQVLGARSGGPGGAGGGPGFGELGKDFVAGEVKSIDAPKLTVLRPDSVTQTLELTEDTSLRKGRESITMADIQPGDHVIVRGGVQNNVFVPKTLILLSAEQWERMQQFASGMPGARTPSGSSQGGSSASPNSPHP